MKTEQLSHNFQRKTFKNMGKEKKKGIFFFFCCCCLEMLKQINKSMILTGSFMFLNKYQVSKI